MFSRPFSFSVGRYRGTRTPTLTGLVHNYRAPSVGMGISQLPDRVLNDGYETMARHAEGWRRDLNRTVNPVVAGPLDPHSGSIFQHEVEG